MYWQHPSKRWSICQRWDKDEDLLEKARWHGNASAASLASLRSSELKIPALAIDWFMKGIASHLLLKAEATMCTVANTRISER